MKTIKNLEIIQLNTVDGKLIATLSYQDLELIGNINNGYSTTNVNVNIREFKLSSRGNILVDQSIKPQSLANETNHPTTSEPS